MRHVWKSEDGVRASALPLLLLSCSWTGQFCLYLPPHHGNAGSTDIERCIQLTQRGLLPCLSSPTLPSSCLLCRVSLCSPRLALNSRSLALQVYTTCLPLTAQFLVCELLNLKCLVGRTYLDLRTCFPESICPWGAYLHSTCNDGWNNLLFTFLCSSNITLPPPSFVVTKRFMKFYVSFLLA